VWVRRLYRHGGSLSIAVPSPICKVLKLRPGRHLAFVLDKERRVILEEVRVGGDRGKTKRSRGG